MLAVPTVRDQSYSSRISLRQRSCLKCECVCCHLVLVHTLWCIFQVLLTVTYFLSNISQSSANTGFYNHKQIKGFVIIFNLLLSQRWSLLWLSITWWLPAYITHGHLIPLYSCSVSIAVIASYFQNSFPAFTFLVKHANSILPVWYGKLGTALAAVLCTCCNWKVFLVNENKTAQTFYPVQCHETFLICVCATAQCCIAFLTF